jgi:uncharacterized membrane protein YdjX (TVP38/TMEM64 family)
LEGKQLYLYEEEKYQKQQGQHLYYRKSHKVSTNGMSVMFVTRTVPTLRFDCVVYLLHVLDRRFLGES